MDGDGSVEIVPKNPGSPIKFYKLEKNALGKPTGKFYESGSNSNTGSWIGFGGINGDSRGDFVVSDGWIEVPVDPLNGKWIHYKEFNLGTSSGPVLIADVNGDGKK